MPKSTTCTLNGSTIDVETALRLRARGGSPEFRCSRCQQRVRAHKKERRAKPRTLNT